MLNGNIKHNVTILLSSYFTVVIRLGFFAVCQLTLSRSLSVLVFFCSDRRGGESLCFCLWISYVTTIVWHSMEEKERTMEWFSLWNSELFAWLNVDAEKYVYAFAAKRKKSVNICVVDSKCRWFQNGSFCLRYFLFLSLFACLIQQPTQPRTQFSFAYIIFHFNAFWVKFGFFSHTKCANAASALACYLLWSNLSVAHMMDTYFCEVRQKMK